MSDPTRTPELEAFVELLRSATPQPSTLAQARADLMDRAGPTGGGPAGGAGGLAARIGYLMLALLAVGEPAPGHVAASLRADAAPSASHTAGAEPAGDRPATVVPPRSGSAAPERAPSHALGRDPSACDACEARIERRAVEPAAPSEVPSEHSRAPRGVGEPRGSDAASADRASESSRARIADASREVELEEARGSGAMSADPASESSRAPIADASREVELEEARGSGAMSAAIEQRAVDSASDSSEERGAHRAADSSESGRSGEPASASSQAWFELAQGRGEVDPSEPGELASEPGIARVGDPNAAEHAPPGARIGSERSKQDARGTASPPAPAAPTGAPSATLAEALRDYSAGSYAQAAVGFQRVVDGTSEDAAQRVAQAEFFLAKCLYHMELYHASAAAFDEVTRRGSAHPYFTASLEWLAMLAERLPEPSGVIESIGRYDAAQLRQLDTAAAREHYHHLLYLLGRARYEERRFAEAVQLLRQVPDGTRWALEARFFEGISHVRQRHARPALAAFRRVIDAVQAGRTGGHEDPNRLYDLAWMSVARLYYSLAMQQPAGRDAQASELLTLAVASWRRIPLSSEYWLESFFEETWALYIGRQYGRALGHVHALQSPYFRDRANPEALVVRAMIYFEHCQWDAVEHALTRFHRRFDPLFAAVQRAERMAATNSDAFRMLRGVQRGRTRVPARAVLVLRAAFADRDLQRHVAQVRSIAREQRRLASMGAPVLGTSLSARVAGELAVIRALAEDRAGELARARVHRLAEELNERMTQMDTVELELATARRDELERPNPNPMGPRDGGRIVAVQGDQIWPFNGEWWRDELPFYIQEVRNRCAR